MGAVLARCPFYALLFNCLAGCALIGPAAVENGRNTYNEAVAGTARQQTLINMVRVHRNENPVFVDIPEIDASSQLQMNATGAITNIGSHAGTTGATLEGKAGAFTGGIQYQEAPTIRYQPVQGQALFTQISAPITVDTLAALFGSDWGFGPILAFAADQWAPSYTDNAAALNMMIWLDSCGAIGLAATRSDFSAEKPPTQHVVTHGETINIQTQAAASGGNDSLDLYLNPKGSSCSSEEVTRIWGWLWKFYDGTQPDADGVLWSSGRRVPLRIELRTTPIKGIKAGGLDITRTSVGPILRTHSALGILKSIDAEPRLVEYVTPEEYETITQAPFNSPSYFRRCDLDFAYLMPLQLAKAKSLTDTVIIRELVSPAQPLYDTRGGDSCSYMASTRTLNPVLERQLNHLRRLILIIRSDSPPPWDAYVSWKDDYWYYIDGGDFVSQKNFMLISEYMSIQSTVSSAPSLTAVSVGPH
jgi:hypothetical protein